MRQSLEALRKDPVFGPLISRYGLPRLSRGKTPFQALSRAIIFQQISGKAASSIYARFVALYGIQVRTPIEWESRAAHRFPSPREVLDTPDTLMRSAGLSNQKIRYLKDLAEKFADGTVMPERLPRLSNQEIIETLTRVHGIGVWTVQMFLIFTLHRPDVLPTGDLGIRRGFMRVFGLKTMPAPRTMERLARPWREHASIASWYLWKAADEG
jgi:DNA-3-methyladenine glycosylase II